MAVPGRSGQDGRRARFRGAASPERGPAVLVPVVRARRRVPRSRPGRAARQPPGHRRLRPRARPRPGHRRADPGPAGAGHQRAGAARLGRARPALSGRAALARTRAVRPGDRPGGSDPAASGPGRGPAVAVRTADDDEGAVAAVRAAAYRSLRREVPPPAPAGPEQAPLPLFAAEAWWPRPPTPSPQVIDEAAVAAYVTAAPARLEVRGGSRFPREGLAELVRRAAQRLSRLPEERCYAPGRPLARHIADTGDLRPVNDLLGLLTEAGCDHPTVLDALSEPLEPIEACWMVETLAGVLPGSLLRRHV